MTIDMVSIIKKEYPSLFTKQGKVRKQPPKVFVCRCGQRFNQTKSIRMIGITFGVPICPKCGNQGRKSVSYGVWKRISTGQMEQEDFILNSVLQHPSIQMEVLQQQVTQAFDKKTDALGYLAYFGYLNVDTDKRDRLNIVEYTVNSKKNLSSRYEQT